MAKKKKNTTNADIFVSSNKTTIAMLMKFVVNHDRKKLRKFPARSVFNTETSARFQNGGE